KAVPSEAPPHDEPPPPVEPRIPGAGESLFFADSEALLVIEGEEPPYRISAYGIDCQPRSAPIIVGHRLCLMRRAGSLIALADWDGGLHLFDSTGQYRSFSLRGAQGGFAILGDIAIAEPVVYACLWNGTVYRIAPGAEPARVLRHEGGAQRLAVIGETLY